MSDLIRPLNKVILRRARKTYGNKNQILVCIEELNELACVLAKYPRYENEQEATLKLHDKILDEFADVCIILEHVRNIVGLEDEEIKQRIDAKVDRLNRWLNHSDSMQETVVDRKVEEIETPEPCKTCVREKTLDGFQYENFCKMCLQAQATEGNAIYYIKPQENNNGNEV